MKTLIILAIVLSSTSFAQTLDIQALKNLMTKKQAVLELVNPGMSKQVTNFSTWALEDGTECAYKQVTIQTILKVEADKMVIHAKDTFMPARSSECANAGIKPYVESMLFYSDKPSLAEDLATLDTYAPDVVSIINSGDLVTMQLHLVETQEDGTEISDDVTVQYDLSKSSFKNLVLIQGTGHKTLTSHIADIDPMSFDLSTTMKTIQTALKATTPIFFTKVIPIRWYRVVLT